MELETEIERFKKENAALSRLKQENQEIRENLRYLLINKLIRLISLSEHRGHISCGTGFTTA